MHASCCMHLQGCLPLWLRHLKPRCLPCENFASFHQFCPSSMDIYTSHALPTCSVVNYHCSPSLVACAIAKTTTHLHMHSLHSCKSHVLCTHAKTIGFTDPTIGKPVHIGTFHTRALSNALITKNERQNHKIPSQNVLVAF